MGGAGGPPCFRTLRTERGGWAHVPGQGLVLGHKRLELATPAPDGFPGLRYQGVLREVKPEQVSRRLLYGFPTDHRGGEWICGRGSVIKQQHSIKQQHENKFNIH